MLYRHSNHKAATNPHVLISNFKKFRLQRKTYGSVDRCQILSAFDGIVGHSRMLKFLNRHAISCGKETSGQDWMSLNAEGRSIII